MRFVDENAVDCSFNLQKNVTKETKELDGGIPY